MKVFLASFSRSSNGAVSLLIEKLKREDFYTENIEDADYIVAVGDRWETFDFVFAQYRAGKKIIHLWAGECTPGCDDEIHRHAITLMSDMQLCTNEHAKKRVEALCEVGGKEPNALIIGNIMMDNLPIDESILETTGLEKGKYDLILYNPYRGHIKEDVEQIIRELMEGEVDTAAKPLKESGKTPFIWIRPNTDRGYEYILRYATSGNQARPKFLALMKYCRKFITNSSCMFYEAPFLINKKQIISIGIRNAERESKYAKMDIPNASENFIKILKGLETTPIERRETL